ncbi:MAG TPA: universal stress protein [Chloroflexota bacterium]|nr:universal stress protein [Chloroflexota bacterium]
MTKINHILVPVNGNSTDDEAVRVACTTARKHKARVSVIYVIEVKRTLPLDAEVQTEIDKGEAILDRAERVAGENEMTADTELLQARDVGPAIVDESVERGCDIIVMGLPYKRRFGEYSVGHTIGHVLKNSPAWVWVIREPMRER